MYLFFCLVFCLFVCLNEPEGRPGNISKVYKAILFSDFFFYATFFSLFAVINALYSLGVLMPRTPFLNPTQLYISIF